MDTIAALSAPRVVVLDAETLPEFLKNRAVRVVQAHATDRPFGLVLKGLVHGRMGTHARCGRLDLRSLDGDSPAVRRLFRDWVDLAGIQGLFPPPEGYYLFHDRKLMGFHPAPESDEDSWVAAADIGLKGLRAWASERDLTRGRTTRPRWPGRARHPPILRGGTRRRPSHSSPRRPGSPQRRRPTWNRPRRPPSSRTGTPPGRVRARLSPPGRGPRGGPRRGEKGPQRPRAALPPGPTAANPRVGRRGPTHAGPHQRRLLRRAARSPRGSNRLKPQWRAPATGMLRRHLSLRSRRPPSSFESAIEACRHD